MTEQKGFTLVEGLLIVLIMSVIGFAGYIVWNNQRDDEPVETTQQQTQNNKTLDTQTDNEIQDNGTAISNIDFSKVSYALTLPVGWSETDFQELGRPCGADFPGDWKQQKLTSSNNDTITVYENGGLSGCGGGFNADIVPRFQYVGDGIKFNYETVTLNCEAGEVKPFCAGAKDKLYVVTKSDSAANASNGFAYSFVIETSTRSSDEVSQVNKLLELLETIKFSK